MKRFLALAIAIFAAGYAGWWLYWGWATRRAEAELDQFFAAEAARGRDWSCASRKMDGFPKAFNFICDKPAVSIRQISGPPAVWRLVRVEASASATRTTSARVLLTGPATLTRGDLPPVRVSWAFLEVGIQGLPHPTRVSVLSDAPKLEAAGAPPLSAETVAASLDFASTPTFFLPPGGARFGASIGALSYPPLAEIIKTPTLNFETHGDIAAAAAFATPGAMPARLEAWRLAGGRLDASKIRVWSSAPNGPTIWGSARLSLDEEHRISGQADLVARGLDEIARAFGLPANTAAVGSLLGGLLTNKGAEKSLDKGATAHAPRMEPGDAPLPLRFEKGAVRLGPFRTPIELPPLY